MKALELRSELTSTPLPPVIVDLHPVRPARRGLAPLPKRIPVAALPNDPTFDEINTAGGTVHLNDQMHEMKGRDGSDTGVMVSGEIPRETPFEVGLPGAITWTKDENDNWDWFTDEASNSPFLPRRDWLMSI